MAQKNNQAIEMHLTKLSHPADHVPGSRGTGLKDGIKRDITASPCDGAVVDAWLMVASVSQVRLLLVRNHISHDLHHQRCSHITLGMLLAISKCVCVLDRYVQIIALDVSSKERSSSFNASGMDVGRIFSGGH